MTFAWIDCGNGRQVYRRIDEAPRGPRSSLPAPFTITDTMEPTQHPCTGEYLTSKSKFRQITRAHGCTEVGNDPARLKPRQKPKVDRKTVRDAVQKAKAEFNSGRRFDPTPVQN